MPLIEMWIIAGAIIDTVLTIAIFMISTLSSNDQKMILLGRDPIKSCYIPLDGDGIKPRPLFTNMSDLFRTN